ncbi:hypothetical protein C8J57DRAFT_128916 [Mycena rebaudengoi]|nr:hypothetical protein C8J57DRAFT_128916 [Mycena rebaudengoi]
MADPITVTTTIITLATFITDLIDLGQNIKRSIEKVGENRRRIRDLTNDIFCALANLANLSRGREDSFQAPELLDALANLKADMLHVLSTSEMLSLSGSPPHRRGFRALQSQIKFWLIRDDIESEIKRLKQQVNKCYIQFTAFSAARIEHTSVRVEQNLITNNVENQARLQRLEGMVARVLVHTQFGQNVVDQTMTIVASDPGHQTLESQYLSAQVMRLIDSLQKLAATHQFHSETPYWNPRKPLQLSFVRPASPSHVLHAILGIVLEINDCPEQLSTKATALMLLNLGVKLSFLGMRREAAASDVLAVQVFRHWASGDNAAGCLPRLALALHHLSCQYRYQLRHDLSLQASEQSVSLCHFLSESAPEADNRVLLLTSLNAHSISLQAAGQLNAAISVANQALIIGRILLSEIYDVAAVEPVRVHLPLGYEVQAHECCRAFFCLSGALSADGRHREAHLASKEGLESVVRFSGSIPPPPGTHIDAFLSHMCEMAETGHLPFSFLADAVVLCGNLSHIYPQKFSMQFLLVLYAHTYFFNNHDARALRDLRLFLEPETCLPPFTLDDFTTVIPWIDDWVVEDAVRAFYISPASRSSTLSFFIVYLFHLRFDLAIAVLREVVSSLLSEPSTNWDALEATLYSARHLAELTPPQISSVLEILANIVAHARRSIKFLPSSQYWHHFDNVLSDYCWILWEAGCLHDALSITDEGIQLTTLSAKEEGSWFVFRALIFVDLGRFSDAENARRDAEKRLDTSDVRWFPTFVSSVLLRRTGKSNEALNLLAQAFSEVVLGAESRWLAYFLLADVASTQLEVGQTQRALESAERAVVKCRERHSFTPHAHRSRLAVAHALTTLSTCFAALGRADEGLAAAREAATIYTSLRGSCQLGYRAQELTSNAFHILSLCLAASGHLDEALMNAEKAVRIYRELVSLAVSHTQPLRLASKIWPQGCGISAIRRNPLTLCRKQSIYCRDGLSNSHTCRRLSAAP